MTFAQWHRGGQHFVASVCQAADVFFLISLLTDKGQSGQILNS